MIFKKAIVRGQEMWEISIPLTMDADAGFLFYPHMQQKSLIIDLAITEELDTPHLYDEMEHLKKAVSQSFSNTSCQISTFNYDDAEDAEENFLASNLDGGKEIWKGIISYQRQMFGHRFTNSFNMLHRQFRPYFRCYVNFVMKNPINGRESKKIIREVENLPEFLKSLSWTGGDFIIYTFVLFLEDHICRGKNCGNFTYLKC